MVRSWRKHKRLGLVFFDQSIVSGCSFLTMLLLVNSSGFGVYGAFGIVMALALFVVGLQLALVSQPMMSIGPTHLGAERRTFFGAMLVLQAGFTFVAGLATWAAYMVLQGIWADPLLDGTLVSGSAMILARQNYVFVRNSFFATGRVGKAVVNDCVAFGGGLLGLFAMSLRGPLGLNTIFWTLSTFFGLAALIGLVQYGQISITRAGLARTAARNWRFSRWLTVQSVFQWFSANAIFIAAGSILGSAAVGALKLAQNIVGILGVVLVALENFVPVDAARALSGMGVPGLKRYLSRVLIVGGGATIGIASMIAAWPGLLLQVLSTGESDAWTIEALRWFAMLYVLAFFVTVINIAFRSIERTGELALCHILLSLPMLVVPHPIVAHYGFLGACAALVLHKAILCVVLGATFLWTAGRLAPRPSASTGDAGEEPAVKAA